GLPAQLDHIVCDVKAAVAFIPIDLFKSVTAALRRLKQPGPLTLAATVVDMQVLSAVRTKREHGLATGLFRDGGAHQVNHATCGLRSVTQKWSAFDNFNGVHTQ